MVIKAALGVLIVALTAASGWRAESPLPVARGEVAAAGWNGQITIAGGFLADGSSSPHVDAYNPATNKWTQLPDLPLAVNHALSAAGDGRLYVVGGYAATGRSRRCSGPERPPVAGAPAASVRACGGRRSSSQREALSRGRRRRGGRPFGACPPPARPRSRPPRPLAIRAGADSARAPRRDGRRRAGSTPSAAGRQGTTPTSPWSNHGVRVTARGERNRRCPRRGAGRALPLSAM